MATQYIEITEEIKTNLLTLVETQFAVKDRTANGQPVRGYEDVHAQFISFPVKYILEGIEAGESPEDISDMVYYCMKYGKNPADYRANKCASRLYTGVPMKNYSEGPDCSNEAENMLRYISGKVLIELNKLVKTEEAENENPAPADETPSV